MGALAAFVLGLGVFVHTLLDAEGLRRRGRAQTELALIEGEITELEGRVQTLRSELHGLHTRSDVQERVVRDELGYVRPGELVLEVQARGNPSAKP